MNLYMHEQLAAMRRHELQQAAERYRMASHLAHYQGTSIQRFAGMLGIFLIKTGMKLKQFELLAGFQGI